ncbi:MAG: filamentous hemagglutinin N-terminal domain-containing protein [Tepidisphaera sp.]
MKTNTRGTNAGDTLGASIGGAVGRKLWTLAKVAGRAAGLRSVGGAAVIAGLLAAASTTSVIAGPEGEQVVVGNVTFTRQGNLWIITASNGAIINYASFDILPYETVRFIQPSQLSTVLNRINSAAPTLIQGRLEANGNVFFVNPAGVIFTNTSTVNVGGLYAAAGNLSNEDFLSGNMRFTGLQGQVSNSGNITANAVAMVGREVSNHGSIIAHGGTVVMAAGEEVFIGREGSSVFTQIQGASGSGGQNAGVTNTGRIDARGGQVTMSAGDADGMAIFNTGVIRGNNITIEGQGRGDVMVRGVVDASSDAGRGGEITITGERVGLFNARIDASGTWGGGTIRIGGDAGGQGDTRRADYVFVDENTTVRADAHEFGDGGRITFWGTEATRIAGDLSAMGGIRSGNGGFIETSGGYIALAGTPDLQARAASGRGGQWVIDPNDITIVAGGGNTNINAADPFASADDNAQLGVDLITAALGNGVSVSITTTNSGADSQLGNITLATNLSYTGTGNATLTLNAHNNIVFNTGTTVTGSAAGGLNLVFNADSDNDGSGNVNLNNAAITLNGGSLTVSANVEDFTTSAGGSINTGGGNLTLNNTGVNTLAANMNLGAGAFSSATTGLTTVSGTLTAGSVNVAGLTALNGGTVTTTGGTQTYTGAVTLGANTTLIGTTITFGSTVDSSGGARTLTVNGAGVFNGNVGGLSSLSSLTVTGAATLTNASVTTVTTQTYGGAMNIGGSATTLTGTSISFQNTLDTTVDLTIASTGDVTFTGIASFGGNTTIGGTNITFSSLVQTDVAGDGLRDLTLNGSAITSFFSNVSSGTRRFANITSNGAGSAIVLGTVEATGNIVLSDGSITFASGATSVTAGGDITIGGNASLGANMVFSGANVTFSGTVNDDAAATQRTLTVNSAGTTTFASTVGATRALAALITDAGGTTILTGNVSTTGGQTYNDAVELAGDVVISGATITFASTVDSDGTARALTVNDSGVTTFGGNVGTTSSLASLTTNSGGSTVLTGDVTTTGAQLYQDAVLLDGNATLTGAGIRFASTLNSQGANRTLAIVDTGLTRFDGAVGGVLSLASLNVSGGGTTQIGANITTDGTQTYSNAVTVAADLTLASTTGAINFNNTVDATTTGIDLTVTSSTGTVIAGAVGGTTALGSVTFNGGPITLSADVTTTGLQAYTTALTLAGDATLTSGSGGAITFGSTVDGDAAGRNLTVNTSGTTTFTGDIGGVQALQNLTTDAAGALVLGGVVTLDGTGTFNGSAISFGNNITATTVTFGGPVTLTGNSVLNVVNATFSGTVNADDEANNRTLQVDLSVGGVLTFSGAVGGTERLSTLTVTDAGAAQTIIGANISTLAAQSYASVVTVAGDITLAGTNITFGSSIDADAAANNRSLTISTTGGSTVTFSGAIGGVESLGSLTVTDSGAGTTILSNNVTTSGAQAFNENVTLAGDATFTSSGGAAILFGGTVDSDGTARALTADTAGTITFTGAVGGISELSSLTTLNGTTVISGGLVNTTTLQSYGGAVNITANTTLVSDEIDFNGNVTGTGFTLAFETFTGGANIELGGAGGTGALDLTSAELAFLQDGFAGLTFGDASMVGSVIVAGAITLTDATTFLVDTGNGGTIRLAGNVTVNDVTNAATITFSGPVILEGDITVASTGVGANGDITFGDVINADAAANNRILTVNSQGAVTFTGVVGGVEALGGLVTDAGGTTRITTDITTVAAGNQTYGDSVVLLGNATLTGNNISFDGTINADAAANNRDLIVNGAGAITFSGAVGGTQALNSLTTGGAGTVSILAAITTAGAQLYNNAVTVNSSQLTGGSLTFGSTVDASAAGQDLLVTSTAGDIVFSSAIGATTAFRDITTSAAATFANRLGGNVTADRNITLGGASVITSSITMTSQRMTFGTTLDADAGGRTLTLTSTATTGSAATPLFRFGGNVGSTVAFQTITFSAVSFADPAFSTILFAPTSPFGGDGSVAFGNNISLNADTIDIQDGHRVTALANFTINATDLTVGDITSAGNLNITATNMITIRVRPGGRSETSPGSADNGLDLGADWIALGSITANGAVQFDDGGVISGTLPGGRQFSLATGQGGVVGGTATSGFPASTLVLTSQFASALFNNGGNFLSLDLTSKTTLDQPPIAGLTPRIEVDAVSTPQPVTSELAEFMRSLDMSLKDELSIDDQLEALIGRALYIDMANPEFASAKDRYRVTRERLTTENVKPLRDTFRAVFQREDGVKDDGSPNFVDDSKRVRDTLGKAWKAYKTSSDKADGIGFRKFLEADQANTDNSAALEILDGMQVLFDQIDRLGLSDFEAVRPKNSIINRALSPDIGTNDAARQILRDAIIGEQLEEEVDGMALATP